METNPSLQILVPFIVNKIESKYDKTEKNGIIKKNVYIMVLDALESNRWVDLQFQVRSLYTQKHALTEMLVRMIADDLTDKPEANQRDALKGDSGAKDQCNRTPANVTKKESLKDKPRTDGERRYKGCDSVRDEVLVRENAAKLLAKLALRNDQQKYLSYTPHLSSILVQHLERQLSLSEPNCVVVYSILKVAPND